MKKTTVIVLLIMGFFVFNVAQVSAGCNIVWTGYYSGSTPTNETSRTPQAAQELFKAILWDMCVCGGGAPSFSDNCYGYSVSGYHCAGDVWVCLSGTWEDYCELGGAACGFPGACFYHSGSWDVICDTSTTTTQQSTTTTIIPPTLINLSSFTATPEFSKVIIQWNTEAEVDNAGFNLYRAVSEDGEYIKINTSLIPAKGSSTEGAAYEFIDTNIKNRKTYWYKLEDVDLNGTATVHGTVSATPRLIYGIGK
jgi:hypothetical protein